MGLNYLSIPKLNGAIVEVSEWTPNFIPLFMMNTIICPCFWSSWWRHQMETFSALLAFCAGNSPVTGEFPAQRPVTRSFDVFFDLHLNKRLSKQSRRGDLRRHRANCDVTVLLYITMSLQDVCKHKINPPLCSYIRYLKLLKTMIFFNSKCLYLNVTPYYSYQFSI